MMQYASQGVRNAARKCSNALVHHSGHNGPGGSTTTNQTSRSIHLSSQIRSFLHAPHSPINFTLESIRPRNPPHKLFSASKNFLQRFFTYLAAPGLRAPTYLSEIGGAGSRSLHNGVRGSTIKSGLSLPARHALRNNALQRQANTFLPRAPGPIPPRCGGVAQVGLSAGRNFSSARPIFQNLAQNVPVAGRALYEIDWDIEMRKEQERVLFMARDSAKELEKTKEMIKPNQKRQASLISKKEIHSQNFITKEHIEHYFPSVQVAPVTTYLLIPLAPTPTSRQPLPLDPGTFPTSTRWGSTLLPPLAELGSLHASHSTHALRVSTLFTRLDQANVWARGGVHCSAYSQGHAHRRRNFKTDGIGTNDEGVCTILKVEFVGWTKAEVRSVIGESGSGWCVLEEVGHEEELSEEEALSDMDSLSSEDQVLFTPPFDTGLAFGGNEVIDPAQSFVLPTLEFSSSFLPSSASSASIPSEMETDPWVDDYPYSSSSGSSSYSDLSDLIIDPPSSNGWFGVGHGFGPGVRLGSQYESRSHGGETEPREGMFY